MTTISALGIIVRHVEDAAEGGRLCRACGRPWPCDVRNLVDAMAAEAHAFAAVPRPSAGPFRRSALAGRVATRVPVA